MKVVCVDGPMEKACYEVEGPHPFPQRITFIIKGDDKEHHYDLFSVKPTDGYKTLAEYHYYRKAKQGRKRVVEPVSPLTPKGQMT